MKKLKKIKLIRKQPDKKKNSKKGPRTIEDLGSTILW